MVFISFSHINMHIQKCPVYSWKCKKGIPKAHTVIVVSFRFQVLYDLLICGRQVASNDLVASLEN